VLQNPDTSVKEAAFTQHPRPAYYDREPAKVPQVMGYSVRTAAVRYTEWRDWKTGETLARELYEAPDEPAETRNVVGEPQVAGPQEDAERLLRERFPKTKR
jgi:iduronate 2-sulfatase